MLFVDSLASSAMADVEPDTTQMLLFNSYINAER